MSDNKQEDRCATLHLFVYIVGALIALNMTCNAYTMDTCLDADTRGDLKGPFAGDNNIARSVEECNQLKGVFP